MVGTISQVCPHIYLKDARIVSKERDMTSFANWFQFTRIVVCPVNNRYDDVNHFDTNRIQMDSLSGFIGGNGSAIPLNSGHPCDVHRGLVFAHGVFHGTTSR